MRNDFYASAGTKDKIVKCMFPALVNNCNSKENEVLLIENGIDSDNNLQL